MVGLSTGTELEGLFTRLEIGENITGLSTMRSLACGTKSDRVH